MNQARNNNVTVDDVRAMNPLCDLAAPDKAPPLVVYLAAFRDPPTKRALVTALARAVSSGAVVGGVAKANVLAAAWMTGDGPLFTRLLGWTAFIDYDVAAVAKCVETVDAPRRLRKALRRLEALGPNAKAKTRAAAKNALNAARQLIPDAVVAGAGGAAGAAGGEQGPAYGKLRGATGAFAKRVRAWLRTVPEGKLLFYLLTFSARQTPWRALADVVHARPGDFASPFFLEVAFGSANPNAGSAENDDAVSYGAFKMVRDCTGGEVVETIEQYPFVARELFSFFRQKFPGAELPDAARVALARFSPLHECVWFWDELVAGASAGACATIEAAVRDRLTAGEGLDGRRTNYGKLVQHLMAFRRANAARVFEPDDHVAVGGKRALVLSVSADRARCTVLCDNEEDVRDVAMGEVAPWMDGRAPAAGGAAGRSLIAPLTAYAGKRLEEFRASVAAAGAGRAAARVLVCADMSSSMGVAIRTSAVVASLVSCAFNAEIVLFNAKGHAAATPRSVDEVLSLALGTKAKGCTAPAAALWPAYARLRDALGLRRRGKGFKAGAAPASARAAVFDLVVVVTDEEENTPCNGFRFAELFKKYTELAQRAGAGGAGAPRCFFVSLLSEATLRSGYTQRGGPMVKELEAAGFAPRQFRFSQRRPDLSRLPNLLMALQDAVRGREAELPAAGGGGGGGGGGGEAATGANKVAEFLLAGGGGEGTTGGAAAAQADAAQQAGAAAPVAQAGAAQAGDWELVDNDDGASAEATAAPAAPSVPPQ